MANLPTDTELTPAGFEYVGTDKVRVILKTKAGDEVCYTMSTGMMVRSITLAVDLINSRKVDVLRDVGMP